MFFLPFLCAFFCSFACLLWISAFFSLSATISPFTPSRRRRRRRLASDALAKQASSLSAERSQFAALLQHTQRQLDEAQQRAEELKQQHAQALVQARRDSEAAVTHLKTRVIAGLEKQLEAHKRLVAEQREKRLAAKDTVMAVLAQLQREQVRRAEEYDAHRSQMHAGTHAREG